MPNWCENTLTITGPVTEVKRFVKQAKGYSWGYSPILNPGTQKDDIADLQFNQFVPMPQKVILAGYNGAGYNWEAKNWGVKWGACHSEGGKIQKLGKTRAQTVYYFDTPWGAANEFFRRVGLLFPKLRFTCEYREDGMGFAGRLEVHGNLCHDIDVPFESNAEDEA
jgi:hypothetical protein